VGWGFASVMANRGTQPGCDLWEFSLDLYRRCGVASALIALQDRDRLDVNLMLFALWLGISGRGRLDGDALRAADQTVREIRTEMIEPLRALRRRLKPMPDEDVRKLREGIKALEIGAEKLALNRLAAIAGPADGQLPAAARLAAAHANFGLYIGPKEGAGCHAAVIRKAVEAFARGD
jgi:uncharacterized protein (TIGR02444 family)